MRARLPLTAVAAIAMLFFQDTLARAGVQAVATLGLFVLLLFAFGVGLTRPTRLREGIEPVPVSQPYPPLLVWAFPTWATLLLAFGDVTTAGVQNVIVYWMLPLAASVMAAASTRSTPELVRKWVTRVAVAAALGYVVLVVAVGPGSIEGFHGARGAGWGGALALAVMIPFATYLGGSRLPLVIVLAAVALSLSRTPLAISLALLLLLAFRASGFKAVLRLAAAFAGVGLASAWAYGNVTAIRDRFTQGDGATLFGVGLNSSGRENLWAVTRRHFEDAPSEWIGWGPGSVQDWLIVTTGQEHPHNEYLRFMHDTGWVGLGLWIVGAAAVLLPSIARWRTAGEPVDRACHMAAAASMGLLILGSFTDNLTISILDVLPVAMAYGLSLSRVEATRLSPAVRDRAAATAG